MKNTLEHRLLTFEIMPTKATGTAQKTISAMVIAQEISPRMRC
jgi:hypothetical protein